MSPTTIPMTLHAELLPNIRQIALYVSIPARLGTSKKLNPSPKPEPEISLSLSESRRAVTVTVTITGDKNLENNSTYDGLSETLKLPGRVSEAARVALRGVTKQRAQIVPNTGTGSNGDISEGDKREYSFRMPLDLTGDGDGNWDWDGNDNGNGTRNGRPLPLSTEEVTMDDFVPWTASDMGPCAKVRCRNCRNEVLNELSSTASAGWIWKDLPSENWAEMMDFWHCHKPDLHENEHEHSDTGTAHKVDNTANNNSTDNGKSVDERNAQVKGYGAANRVVAIPGTILVDVSSFLVTEDDCRGLKKVDNTHPSPSRPNIVCTECDASIGTEDTLANGWRLLKANLSVATHGHGNEHGDGYGHELAAHADDKSAEREKPGTQELPTWESKSVEVLVSAQILEMIERESARRFVMHSDGKRGLLLWIFNPDLRYSNTKLDETHTYTRTVTSQRAMKVFFQDVPDVERLLNPDADGPGGSGMTVATTPFSLEELECPSEIFAEILRVVTCSNELLPGSARQFREWKVGLLSRFERSKAKERRS